MMTFGSLFSGIGGMDLGLERAGMQCIWQVEIDEYGIQVLTKQYPDVPKYRDVRSIGRHRGSIHTCYIPVSDVDAVVGGFPCQPQSLAGKRKASKDARNLWPEFYRIVCELKPRWVMVENVLGLLSSENGAFFGGILRDLAKAGYDARWQVLRASDFGAPHLRERVLLVAYANRDRQRIGQDQQKRKRECPGASYPCANGAQGALAYATSRESRGRKQPGLPSHAGTGNSQLVESATSCRPQECDTPEWIYDQSHTPGELAYADFQSLEVGNWSQSEAGACFTAKQYGSGTAQSPLGRIFNGLPRQLDGYRWPAGPGYAQFAWEAPRVITWKMPWRSARLKGLGNAVVVALAEYVGREIMAAEMVERQVSHAC